MKRPVDITLAALGVVVSAPLWIPLAVAIRIESPGPILHRAVRVGRFGRTFTLLKFRSMRVGVAGPGVTAGNDARITRTGRLLRRTKLDEIPQLINVLRGDMSLVGPRPEDPRYVARYSDEQRVVLAARPGITGAAAIAYRHEEVILATADNVETTYVEVVMPAKLELEIDYLEKQSLLVDLSLLIRTAFAIFARAEHTTHT